MSTLRISSWNAQSKMLTNWKEILRFLKKSKSQICCIQDTGCVSKVQQMHCFNNKHQFIIFWGIQNSNKSRNFAIVMKKNVEVLEEFKYCSTDLMTGVIQVDSCKIRLWNIYVPPSEAEKVVYTQKFLEIFNSTLSPNIENVICGDFNMLLDPKLDYVSNTKLSNPNKNSETTKNFFSCLNKLHLSDTFRSANPNVLDFSRQGIYKKADGTIHISQSRIDYIFASNVLITNLTLCHISRDLVISDHYPIVCEFNLKIDNESQPYLPPRSKITLPKLNDKLWEKWSKTIERNFFTNHEVNEDIDTLSKQIQSIIIDTSKQIFKIHTIDPNQTKQIPKTPFNLKQLIKYRKWLGKSIGIISLGISKKEPFDSKKLQKLIKKINKHNESIKVGLNDIDPLLEPEEWIRKASINRKTISKSIHKLWRKQRNLEFHESFEKILLAQEKDINVIYKRLQSKSRVPITKVISPIPNDVRIVSDENEVKELTLKFWQDIFSSRSPEPIQIPEWLSKKIISVNSESLTNEILLEDVKDAILTSANNKGAGPDEITYEMLKKLPKNVLEAITRLFNLCLQKSRTPNNWHQSMIFPIYKKGNPNHLGNYRPISLLPAIYKIFSKILTKRLSNTVENNHIIHEEQNGFRPERDTFTNILTLLKIIEHSKRNKKELHLFFIDITKAYDSVEHWAVKQTLEFYNINTRFSDLIINILENNSTSMITGFGPTEPFSIESGVKQGDPISPLLFLLFMNPLIGHIKNKFKGYSIENLNIPILAYADDLVLISDNVLEISEMFKTVTDFLDFNNMKLNVDKDKSAYTCNFCMNPPNFFYRNKPIPFIQLNESYPYLGIDINLNLDFSYAINSHINKYKASVSYILSKAFTIDQTITLINSVSNPIVGYLMNIINIPKQILESLDSETVNKLKKKMRIMNNSDSDFFFLERNLKRLTHLQMENLTGTVIDRIANGNNLATKILHTTNHWSSESSFGFQAAKELLKSINFEIIDTKGCLANLKHMFNSDPINNYLVNQLIDAKFKCTQQLLQPNSTFKSIDLINFQLRQCKINKQINSDIWKIVTPKWTLPNNKIKPELLTNLELPSLQEIYKIMPMPLNQNSSQLLIWTDGSVSNNFARSGIYINDNSPFNVVCSTLGDPNILNAELQAIEIALIVGEHHNLHIISDNLTAITIIEKCKQWTPKDWRKCHTKATLSRIMQILQTRKNSTTFTHIYSHIEEKLDRAQKTSLDEFRKWVSKIRELRTKLGDNFETFVEGNNKVDKLVTETVTEPTSQLLFKGLNRFVVLNNEKRPIEFNLRKVINQKLVQIDTESWIKRCKIRTEYKTNNQILQIDQKDLFNRCNIRNENLANFWHKIKQHVISSKDMFHKFFKSKKPPKINATLDEEIAYEYGKKFYNSNICHWCHNESDTFTHAMSYCIKAKKPNKLLHSQCMEIINKYAKGKVDHTNLWFPHDDYDHTPDMFKTFDKTWGAKGFLPANLPDVLKIWRIPEKFTTNCVNELFSAILTNRYNYWRKRWECFNRHLRTQQIKKNLRTEIKIRRRRKKSRKRKKRN